MAKKSLFLWQAKEMPDDEQIDKFKEENSCSKAFATLCLQRGIQTKEQLQHFLNPRVEHLYDPYLLYDMKKTVDRIQQAIVNNERILIYGDYDADGITSTTILYETIESLGGNVQYYLPNRFTDGYGPNVEVYRYMIDVEKVQLIVTCDNGVAGHQAIQFAMDKGIDVIVTDHHELPEILPNAYAVVHPRHPKGNYPFGELSGAGVAFKVATALLNEVPIDLLEVVMIGTIADVVSLTQENRTLVQLGLQAIKQTQRIGLLTLFEALEIVPNSIDTDTIGFVIAPRLNALGRMDDATLGVELFITFDDEIALDVVKLLEEKNNERKQIVDTITQDVLKQVDATDSFIVLANKNWHAGVLGIVASRVVEQLKKPVILLQIDEETGIAKGSARSLEGVNLYAILTEQAHLLDKFGGHSVAAGLSIKVENIQKLKEALSQLPITLPQPTLTYDLSLTTQDCLLSLVHELDKLAPFGTDNPRPFIHFKEATLSKVKVIGAQNNHVKAQANQLDVLKFNATEVIPFMKDGTVLSFIGQLTINEWNQLERVQCQLNDIKIEGVQYFDMRQTTVSNKSIQVENALYVFDTPKYYAYFKDKLPENSQAIYYADCEQQQVENLVLFECPSDVAKLEKVLTQTISQNIYVQMHTLKSAYLIGLPTRKQFAKLYSVITTKKQLSIREQLDQLANYLQVSKELLILMIQVFLEVAFVTMEDGILSLNEKRDLSEKISLELTNAYRKQQQKIDIEQLVIYTQFSELVNRFKLYEEKEK